MEKNLSFDLRKLARKLERHPNNYDLIRIQNFLFYMCNTIVLPVDIWCYIFSFIFDTINYFKFLLYRPTMMACLNKDSYKECLIHFNFKMNSNFPNIKRIYNNLQYYIRCRVNPMILPKRDIIVVVNNMTNNIYDDITDSKTLGNFLNFVHNCEGYKENLIRAIPYCNHATKINFHMAALISHCGGKNAICPFNEFDTISISLDKETRTIWYVEKNITHTIALCNLIR